jgi:hypothetical protein
MFKFTKNFLAAALAMASIGASAQDSTNKSDPFGQDQYNQAGADNATTPSGAMGTGSMTSGTNLGAMSSRKVIIANTPPGQAAAAVRGLLPGAGNINVPGNVSVNGNGTVPQPALGNQTGEKIPELSEFQKFIADNTGQI